MRTPLLRVALLASIACSGGGCAQTPAPASAPGAPVAGDSRQAIAKAEFAGPYVPTPSVIVEQMLRLARVGAGDYLIDLGSGDGRILIEAVSRFGARGGFGVDIDEELVALATRRASEAKIGDRVRFHQRDLFATDVSTADVVTLYLLPSATVRLAPKLLAEMRPGARVVSHDYPLAPWREDDALRFDVDEKVKISGTTRTVLYLYTVPARIAGEWDISLPAALAAQPIRATFTQPPEGARIAASKPGMPSPVASVEVRGRSIALSLSAGAGKAAGLMLRGEVDDDRMEGTVVVGERSAAWSARRVKREAPAG